jgi:formate hydrogenlyase transcriptional activator
MARRSTEARGTLPPVRDDSEALLRRAIGAVPALIGVATGDGSGEFASQRFLDYTGLAPDDVRGQGYLVIFHPDDLPRFADVFRAAQEAATAFELEARLRRADGTYRWFHIMVAPLRDEQGRVTRWYGSISDIDDRKAAEDRLDRAYQQISALTDRLSGEQFSVSGDISLEHTFGDVVGTSRVLKATLREVERVSPTDATVLLLGETGTGKELLARAIHRISARRDQPFVRVNCAAIPATLLESELFGYEKGAFTGASSAKVGRFEMANRGTLFLDEVGDIPLEVQPKLLRAIQEREFERLGGTRTHRVDLRLIAATNRDLESMAADGLFRTDLYYRLNVVPIRVPSLRERREDIPTLVQFFIRKHARLRNRPIESVPASTMCALQQWSWPGNVRELENVIERAVILSSGPILELGGLGNPAQPARPPAPSSFLDDAERQLIVKALRQCNGIVGGPKGAAARLGIKRTTLQSKIRRLGIQAAR